MFLPDPEATLPAKARFLQRPRRAILTHHPSRRHARRASFRTGSSAEEPVSQDPLWYKDAVSYKLHIKTFHGSNGDGIR